MLKSKSKSKSKTKSKSSLEPIPALQEAFIRSIPIYVEFGSSKSITPQNVFFVPV